MRHTFTRACFLLLPPHQRALEQGKDKMPFSGEMANQVVPHSALLEQYLCLGVSRAYTDAALPQPGLLFTGDAAAFPVDEHGEDGDETLFPLPHVAEWRSWSHREAVENTLPGSEPCLGGACFSLGPGNGPDLPLLPI